MAADLQTKWSVSCWRDPRLNTSNGSTAARHWPARPCGSFAGRTAPVKLQTTQSRRRQLPSPARPQEYLLISIPTLPEPPYAAL